MRFLLSSSIVIASFLLVGHIAADEIDQLKQVAADKLATFKYPGSQVYHDNNLGRIAQLTLVTADSLAKVDEWYRNALKIDKDTTGGVVNIPWPAGTKATEAKGQQQWAVFQDDIRLQGNGTRDVDIRAGTTRNFVIRTPEHTLVVTLNRAPEDKQTFVSVVMLGEAKRQ